MWEAPFIFNEIESLSDYEERCAFAQDTIQSQCVFAINLHVIARCPAEL